LDQQAKCSVFAETDANAILELFGSFFFQFCEEAGYGVIMRTLGSSVREFLEVSCFKFSRSKSLCWTDTHI